MSRVIFPLVKMMANCLLVLCIVGFLMLVDPLVTLLRPGCWGQLCGDLPSVARRIRRTGEDMMAAYEDRCALCGLGIGLVEGAHILPVGAQGSPDAVWNGVALCRNHHRAFDTHRIYVDPDTLAVKQHRSILKIAQTDPAVRLFSEGTAASLRLPKAHADRPRPTRCFALGPLTSVISTSGPNDRLCAGRKVSASAPARDPAAGGIPKRRRRKVALRLIELRRIG